MLPCFQFPFIFTISVTTAAAIDRLVHHSVILELNIEKEIKLTMHVFSVNLIC